MIYYFDVKKIFVKTVGIEADNLQHACERVEDLYDCNIFDLGKFPQDIEIEYVQDEVENCIAQGDLYPEEIEVFN